MWLANTLLRRTRYWVLAIASTVDAFVANLVHYFWDSTNRADWISKDTPK